MNAEFTPELQAQLLDDYYTECDEHLKTIREALARLDASIGKAQCDETVLEELFRSFHSFKGISAIVGLTSAEQLAHSAEDFLRGLTKGAVSLSAEGLEVLMAAAQKLEQIVAAFRAHETLPAHDAAMRDLGGFSDGATESQPDNRGGAGAKSVATGTGLLDDARARGLILWRCVFVPSRDLDQRGVNINWVRDRLTGAGEILSATPEVRGEGNVAFEFIVGMKETPADIAQWESDGIAVELMEQGLPPNSSPTPATPAVKERPTPETPTSPFIAPSHIVRVDLNRLDELMRITGEMVIHRSRFEEQISRAARGSGALDTSVLHEVNAALARSLRELRNAIMRVRLVSVAEIFARMPFVVRDLARDTKKKAKLVLEGQQTALDKYLIERLKDPLLHLVRNAFSHGVETPEERAAAGKPVEASILLRAATIGDSVLIQVRDDGRGVDAKEVASRAAAAGMEVPPVLDNAAVLNILCSPGFSTRVDVDRASGRGIGMAVVSATLRELGGSLSLETELGRGSQFTLRLPLTLAIAETLIVSAADQKCAVPQSFVSEVLQITERQIRVVNHVEVIPYRAGILPIVRLRSMFRAQSSGQASGYLLVLSSEHGSTGLLVDQLHGLKEVVVRALQDPLVQIPGIAGATELGDGRPVLILDGAVLTSGAVRPHAVKKAIPEPRAAALANSSVL